MIGIHTLINNAGIYPNIDIFSGDSVQMFDKVSILEFLFNVKVLSVNLRGSYICAKYCAQSMVNHKIQGTIINIASTRAFMSEPVRKMGFQTLTLL